jgi:hypothetical protein
MGPWEPIIGIGCFALISSGVFALIYLQRRANRAFVWGVAESAGWTDIKRSFTSVGVKGMWRQLPAQFRLSSGGGQSAISLILAVNAPFGIRAQSAAVLRVKRKSSPILSFRPLTLLGPSTAIDLGETTSRFWVWGDRAMAVRIFADPAVTRLIGTNLVDVDDQLLVYAKGFRVRCGMRTYGMIKKESLDAKYGPVARHQFVLAEALLGVLR